MTIEIKFMEEKNKEELKYVSNKRIKPGFYVFVLLIIGNLFFIFFPYFYAAITKKIISRVNAISISVIIFLIIIAVYFEIKQPFLPLSRAKKTRYLRLLLFIILLVFIFFELFLIVKLNQGNSTDEIIKNVLEGLAAAR
jgi:amino acid transporter